MKLCNVDEQTGFCEYCGCQSARDRVNGGWYCTALEAELEQQSREEYEDDEWFRQEGMA